MCSAHSTNEISKIDHNTHINRVDCMGFHPPRWPSASRRARWPPRPPFHRWPFLSKRRRRCRLQLSGTPTLTLSRKFGIMSRTANLVFVRETKFNHSDWPSSQYWSSKTRSNKCSSFELWRPYSVLTDSSFAFPRSIPQWLGKNRNKWIAIDLWRQSINF